MGERSETHPTLLHPPSAAWIALSSNSKCTAASSRECMLDVAVDDLDGMVARLVAKGVEFLGRDDSDPSGRFAWILDPDGTTIELWQPGNFEGQGLAVCAGPGVVAGWRTDGANSYRDVASAISESYTIS